MTVISEAGKMGTNTMSLMHTGDFTDQSEVPAGIFFQCIEQVGHHILNSFTGWGTSNSL